MNKLLIPNLYVKSVLDISYDRLRQHNIKGLILDIDNTLARHGELMSHEVVEWLLNLKQRGIKICIMSNNTKHRVESCTKGHDLLSIHSAKKPLKLSFKKALLRFNLPAANVAIIGDQLLSDVLGGNRMGLTTILVDPLSTRESLILKPKRWIERRIMKDKKYD